MTLRVELKGDLDAAERARRVARGLARMSGVRVFVGARAWYAEGIHEGRFPNGRLARRAGPSRFLTRAIDRVMGQADADLSQGMEKVTAPGPWVLMRLGRWARRLARQFAPRVSGRLRRSIVVERRSGGRR